MMGHKICFYGEMWLIIPKLSLMPLLIWSTGPPFEQLRPPGRQNMKRHKVLPFGNKTEKHRDEPTHFNDPIY